MEVYGKSILLDINILHNISFSVQQKKEMHTDLDWPGDE